jgi:hypothetical protein
MKKPTELQIVRYNGSKIKCRNCDQNLTDINNTTYLKQRWGSPKYWDELCQCDDCGNKFILRYELFDKEGHVYLFVFTEDINNPNYNWIDNLNNKQRIAVTRHVEQCSICQKKIEDQLCMDAILKTKFKEQKEKNNK